jgi:hypothetical protein
MASCQRAVERFQDVMEKTGKKIDAMEAAWDELKKRIRSVSPGWLDLMAPGVGLARGRQWSRIGGLYWQDRHLPVPPRLLKSCVTDFRKGALW